MFLILGFELIPGRNLKHSDVEITTREEREKILSSFSHKISYILEVLENNKKINTVLNHYQLFYHVLSEKIIAKFDVDQDDVSEILLGMSNAFASYPGWKNGDFNIINVSSDKYFIIDKVVSPKYI